MTSPRLSLKHFKEIQQAEAPQSVIIYGQPKAGKTTMAGELVRKYKLIWLDIEKGYQTLFNSIPEELSDNITIVPVVDTGSDPNAIKTVGRLFTENRNHRVCWEHGVIACVGCTKAAPEEFTTINLYDHDTTYVVVVDSLTQLGDSAMAHALGPVDTFSKKKTEYDHYDRQGLLLKNILNAMKRLRCHVVFISHEEELEQEDGSKQLCPVAGTRNFSRKVGRYFDHVVHLQVKNKRHRAVSGTTAELKVQSGSRNNVALEQGDSILDIFTPKVMAAPEKVEVKAKTSSTSAAEMLAKINARKQGAAAAKESSANGGDNQAEA